MKNNVVSLTAYHNTFVGIVFFLIIIPIYAQNNDSFAQDSAKTKISLGKIQFKNPKSIISKYRYDPILDRYIYSEKIGEYNIKYPVILTPEQYFALAQKEGINDYFQKKIDASSGKKGDSEKARKNLLPVFYTNNNFFESIFGGNSIEVIPSGNVSMDLGGTFQKDDNPALSPRNRSNFTFNFDQRINLSLVGKVGKKLQVSAQYNTEASFDFQNLIKLEYLPTEDAIIRKIEFGNVSMPLNNALITGAQSLFGVKTELQFGKTTVTGVFAEQRSQNKTVQAQGGGALTDFSLLARDYDQDRHFFLAQYFRDNYDSALERYPFINSPVQITRVEVWVTNRNQGTDNTIRNIVGIQDLGEYETSTNIERGKTLIYEQTNGNFPTGFFNANPNGSNELPRNNANDYNPEFIETGGGVLNTQIRDIASVQSGFNVPNYRVRQGFDYAILENAYKLIPNRDFTFHPQLGYISLNQRLSNDEILGVTFQYTYRGQVYQVGEFGNGGIDATTANNTGNQVQVVNNTLVVKLLKSSITNVTHPIWDLMMKNIYDIGAFELIQENFKLNILYTNPTPRNYITPVDIATWPAGLEEKILIDVFNFDRLNIYNDIQNGGDGFFDFVPGITVNQKNGKIIFTKVEPFGEYLFTTLGGRDYYGVNPAGNPNTDKYVFRSMYEQTKTASLEDANKNSFQIRGRYKSEGGNGIPLGAFNIPRGSVRVTAGNRILREGIDYTVDYIGARVFIINPELAASNIPIQASVENTTIFGQQARRFTGLNIEHQFNEKFTFGATLLNLKERPLTQKVTYGTESVNNSIFGLHTNFSTETPFLSRLVNKLPHIDTDAPSTLSFQGEFAHLRPNAPKNSDFNGETTVYIDDFEGAQTFVDIRSALGWSLSSRPKDTRFMGTASGDILGLMPEDLPKLRTGYNRAKIAWYTIDPIFYTGQRPGGITEEEVSSNETRRIFNDELFPEQDIAQGQQTVINTLDLAYYPNEKGPYNLNTRFSNLNEEDKWGGIMRHLGSTDFEQNNVEFIQFWVLDPYSNGEPRDSGELVFNLGNISEDILEDGRKQYENGLPGSDTNNSLTIATPWGKVPAAQSLIYAFDTNEANRTLQDIGYDGLNDAEEIAKFGNINGGDPMLDNYNYYLNREGTILERYSDYNNPQGNSPVQVTNTNRGATTLPDREDLDRDLTMNTIDSYFEFRIPIQPNTTVGDRFVTDIKELDITTPDNKIVKAKWIQYKVPIRTGGTAIGGISDLRSISFIRMYMTGFKENTVLRFGTLNLVNGDWRTYTSSLHTPPVPQPQPTILDVATVNIEENEKREPIPYVLPPGVFREQLNNNNTIIRQNEQSLSLKITNLQPRDSKAVFKNVSFDMRQYKNLKMFIHAENIEFLVNQGERVLADNDVVAFIRMGADFTDNYYQIELPLKITNPGETSAESIWKNQLELALGNLSKIKSKAIADNILNEPSFYRIMDGEVVSVGEWDATRDGELRYAIRGNPSTGTIRTLMIGIKNRNAVESLNAELWFNELRLSELDNTGGWAAVSTVDLKIADFANINASGGITTPGFGSIDRTPNERNREDVRSYDVITNVNIGQLFPKKYGLQLPFNYGISEKIITPEFDPVYDDLKLKDRINEGKTEKEKTNIREQAEDYTRRTSINFIGVKKNRTTEKTPRFYDIENFTFNYSYNESNQRNFEIQKLKNQNIKTGFSYNHNFTEATIAPFQKKDSLFTGKYWRWLKEFNFNLLPTSIAVTSNINRTFTFQKFREVFDTSVNPEDQLGLPDLQQRNFLFDWQYNINYKFTKSLSANFRANNARIVRNYFNEDGRTINKDLSIWNGFWDTGSPDIFNQQLQVNYSLPLNKIPFLDFMKSTYSYTSTFDWRRGGDALAQVANENINTIQNSSLHEFNTTLSMSKFYRYLGLKKTTNSKKNTFVNKALDVLTMIKRLTISYRQNNGKALPGYTESVGFLGTTNPSLGFVFGDQSNIRSTVAKNGWLTTFNEFNQPYLENSESDFVLRGVASPMKGLTIDLTANRKASENYSENFEVINSGNGNFRYNPLLGNRQGNFSISTILIGTAFSKSDDNDSKTFDTFRKNRLEIAKRLAVQRGNNPNDVDNEGFPIGYGKNSQDVLLPSFLAAYTGKSSSSISLDAFRTIPIPNWNVKYTGLLTNKWFRKRFRRFSITHGYRSNYNINAYQSNLEKENLGENARDVNGNYLSDNLFYNISLQEQFNPLVRLNFEMKNTINILAEIRKSRSFNLNFDNSLLTEENREEYIFGLGYRIKDLKIRTKIGGKKTTLKGDLRLKADFSLRDNISIIRNLDINSNQITSGQKLFSFKFNADYALSRNLNVLFFYDHNFSEAKVSTSFPRTTINSGFTFQYNFGN